MKNIIITFSLFTILNLCTIADDIPRIGIFLIEKSSPELDKIELAKNPLLTDADILSYDWRNHFVTLTPEGFKKLPSIQEISSKGLPFVLVADGQRCYHGAFWTNVSSISCPNPVIIPPLKSSTNIIRIQRAYPAEKFATGDDPRPDTRILKVLKDLNKLKMNRDKR